MVVAADYIEQDILQRIANGDENAFTMLYHRHWKKLYSFLVRMTKSREIAEELTQDIFTKLWVGREIIYEIQDMDSFLYKVAHNKALDFFRLTATRQKLQSIVAMQLSNIQNTPADEKLLDNEAKEILHEAVQQLSPQRRLVFTLSREHGLTHDQIAEQLNLSSQTVKKTMSQALSSIVAS